VARRQAFTAADVKFALENIVNPHVKALFRSQLQGLQRVEAPDDLTARLVFKDPMPALPIVLGYNIFIAPKHLLEGKDLNTLDEFIRQPVGTGPFKFRRSGLRPSRPTRLRRAQAAHRGLQVIPDVTPWWPSSAPESWTWPWSPPAIATPGQRRTSPSR
jgi:ABC-type transport system substrate-binding protein